MAALTGLPRSLIERGLLEEAQAKDIFARATKKGASFISVAVAENAVSAHDVASVASEDFGLPLFDLNAVNADILPKEIVSPALIEKHRILPLFVRGKRLFIAQSDPSAVTALNDIKFHARKDGFALSI